MLNVLASIGALTVVMVLFLMIGVILATIKKICQEDRSNGKDIHVRDTDK